MAGKRHITDNCSPTNPMTPPLGWEMVDAIPSPPCNQSPAKCRRTRSNIRSTDTASVKKIGL